MEQLPPRDLYDCCTLTCYTFAFDGSSTLAPRNAPPVFPSAAWLKPFGMVTKGLRWCTTLFTRFPTGYSLDRVYRNGTATVVVAEVLIEGTCSHKESYSIVSNIPSSS